MTTEAIQEIIARDWGTQPHYNTKVETVAVAPDVGDRYEGRTWVLPDGTLQMVGPDGFTIQSVVNRGDFLGKVIDVPVASTTWGPFTHGLNFEPHVTCVDSGGTEFIPDHVAHVAGTVTAYLGSAAGGKLILA